MSKSLRENIIELIYDLRYLKYPEFTVFNRYLFEEEKQKIEIEEYLDGNLPDHDKKEFEERLKYDKKIQKELEFRKRINDSIGVLKYKEELENSYNKIYNTNKNVRKLAVQWSAAACFAAIIGLSLFFILNTRLPVGERLYSSNYKPLNEKDFFNSSSIFEEGKKTYFSGDYKKAFIVYSNVSPSVNVISEKNLFTALSLMELDSYIPAIDMLKEDTSANTVLAGFRYWYLGLCYLKTNQVEEAKKIFKAISDNKSYNHKKASKILRRLK